MGRLPRASTGALRQARHRRAQYPTIETQPPVQPGDLVDKATGREDRLRAFAEARGLAPCTTRFAEHGLAQYFISWLCRLHADLRIRSRVKPIDETGRAEAERDYVCGGSSMALPPFAHRRCADRTRDSGRRHYEHEKFPGSFAHSFCTCPRSSHHVPCRAPRRRATQRTERKWRRRVDSLLLLFVREDGVEAACSVVDPVLRNAI